jgi:hypothetical protein
MYICEICHHTIINEAHGGPKPSAGDHDPAYHVAKAYNTGWKNA